MNESGRARIFLDGGGSNYGSPSEPVDEQWDSNQWLYSWVEDYRKFLSDRIIVEELIARLDTRLYSANWFVPLGYRLFLPDAENEEFYGTYSNKYKTANLADTDFSLQLRCSFERDRVIELLVNSENPDKKRSKKCASILANCFNSIFDVDDSYLDSYEINECSVHDSDLEYRDFAHDSSYADHASVTMVFCAEPEERLASYLHSESGITELIHALSLSFDTLVESGVLKGKDD